MSNVFKSRGNEIDSLFRLALALNHLNKDIERAFKLSLVQLFVLLRVRALPGTCSHVLSGVVGVKPSTLTATLQRLLRKEYVFVTEDPRDSRRKLIALTRRGNEAVEAVYRDLNFMFDRAVRKRETDALEDVLRYLENVRREIGECHFS